MTNTHFYAKYLSDAENLKKFKLDGENEVAWKSPSNIALLKYWGKHGNQLPDNPSISFTLSQSITQTKVTYRPAGKNEDKCQFYFEGSRHIAFESRISAYLSQLSSFLPFLNDLQLTLHSQNTFPHSAGIASSASSISSLALCLASIENQLFGTLTDKDEFLQKSSFLARLGSGSACRSVYGNCVLWGFTPLVKGSSDEIAIPINSWVHPVFTTYNDAILVVDSSHKEMSSSHGHKLMNSHFYRDGRIAQSDSNLEQLIIALKDGNQDLFTKIVENEALSLHGLILSSNPGYILMKPNTLHIIQRIRDFRSQAGLPITYTLDAGSNVHLLYPQYIKKRVTCFIENELQPLCENGLWINDTLSSNSVSFKKMKNGFHSISS